MPNPESIRLWQLARLRFQTFDRFYDIGNKFGLHTREANLDKLIITEVVKEIIKRVCGPVAGHEYAELFADAFYKSQWGSHTAQISGSKH